MHNKSLHWIARYQKTNGDVVSNYAFRLTKNLRHGKLDYATTGET
jgi:hypothetical protein